MSKKVTIYDLAENLKVSAATVSRALNDHPSISKKTKDKINGLAAEYGYRTNTFAANLSNQKSNTIGVIVPRLNSYFMSTVLAGIEQVANTAGYNLIISQSQESEAKEKINTKTLLDSGVDALLVSLANETTSFDHFNMFTSRNIPLLFFDRIIELPNCPVISIDNTSAGYEATKCLIDKGCKNILHIAGNLNRSVYKQRFKGFKNALFEHKLKCNTHNLLETDLNPKNIEIAINHILNVKQKFDGIFVSSDNYAANIIHALHKVGYKIPDTIKIIGFNNDPISSLIQPNLSTIEYPGFKMGILAGESVIAHLKGNINLQVANSIVLHHQLKERASTQKKLKQKS